MTGLLNFTSVKFYMKAFLDSVNHLMSLTTQPLLIYM